ncbi:ABC transporter substrate-binding protein [Methylotuvimicrobium buryatense]|uniref:Hopanoid biosynthesis protein HpnM n=1 Tax=Methylotuvimicrobium buryatense TaxID=95641 RepID=A0A4P9UQ09_METBY|nr:ABC transporter substrate-binding protein [Methylotuvimicrobium buryatense]QCW83468.1 hopanoid biosynthesis protein HpnM [Methylotuvimicrobium buryatense]
MYQSLINKISVLFLLLLLGLTEVYAEDILSAREVVENFQDELLDVMKNGKELGYKGRFDKLEKPVIESHDLNMIARVVVGREWENMSSDQQDKFVEVFSRFSVASYAHNFKEYSGESFKFESEEETGRGGVIVHTYLVIPDDKDVKFDYMLKKKGNSWKIINIIANGVSDLALRRSEYGSILKRDGYDVLIEKISEKIDLYSKQ